MYVCNCPDSLIATTICKHIHLVSRSSPFQDENYARQWFEDGADYSETLSTHQDLKKNFAEKTAEVNFLKDCLKKAANNDRETGRERRKQSLKTKLLTIVSDIEGCENEDALQQLERSINSAHSLFTSILEHGNKHLPTPKENVPHKRNIFSAKTFLLY